MAWKLLAFGGGISALAVLAQVEEFTPEQLAIIAMAGIFIADKVLNALKGRGIDLQEMMTNNRLLPRVDSNLSEIIRDARHQWKRQDSHCSKIEDIAPQVEDLYQRHESAREKVYRMLGQINELHNWHKAVDSDGVKLWYVSQGVRQSIATNNEVLIKLAGLLQNIESDMRAARENCQECRRFCESLGTPRP
jgi:DNA repair exonuclease SbcCD ATPase subunit